MSLKIRRIALTNFRKFREPLVIEGLGDGLNILIEPNEAGKSTLLEGLRAGFFVRHATRSQLAQSFTPHGESVAPEIEVGFDIANDSWTLSKRFMKGARLEVQGPGFRAQGDDAEAKLQSLLGFARDTSQKGDPNTSGALGLLWVAQADALHVTPPGSLVRDSVTATLEAEVGTIMGGPDFDRVRSRVDTEYASYWTPTGRPTGKLAEAQAKEQALQAAMTEAVARLAGLEQNYASLENAQGRMKSLMRELADPSDAETRRALTSSLEIARAAAQILATRKAEQLTAHTKLLGLEELSARNIAANAAVGAARQALIAAQTARADSAGELALARTRAEEARGSLVIARAERLQAREALSLGEKHEAGRKRRIAADAARKRGTQLLQLEAAYSTAESLSQKLIPADIMAALEAGDRAIAEARAAIDAGATELELTGVADGLEIDGELFMPGTRRITQETRITLPGSAVLTIKPPRGSASAAAKLLQATDRQNAILTRFGVDDLGSARARNETAREAAAQMRVLRAQIDGVAVAVPEMNLVAGPEALKLFIANLPEALVTEDQKDGPALETLKHTLEEAEASAARAEGVQESAIASLRQLEEKDALLAASEAGASRDLANAEANLKELQTRSELADLSSFLTEAREVHSVASVRLSEAEAAATAHDQGAITRKIEAIDARARATAERHTELLQEIARLGATIETEGGKGLADRAQAAKEEAEAATLACQRMTDEAETIKLLRQTLEEARAETAQAFVGPVAKRAKHYIDRILPNADLAFGDDLGLQAIIRSGILEQTGNLSRGTQEQLAVLTRLAFADMLLEQGNPVSLILDDPLVYSDDGRLEAMTDLLLEASERMQVILLTCRDRAFRHLPGKRLVISHPR